MLGLWACVCWYFPRMFKLVMAAIVVALVCAAYVPLVYLFQTNAVVRTSFIALIGFGLGILVAEIAKRL